MSTGLGPYIGTDASDTGVGSPVLETPFIASQMTVDIGGSRTEKIKQSWSVEATASIEFKVGESKITMTPASIKIESPMIEIQATATLQAKAAGPVIVQGTPIMLN